MLNKEISQKLLEIAELLSLGDENPFRVRAYENASRIIDSLGEPVEDLAYSGKLLEIKGIGQGIDEKVNEYISSGKISFLEELRGKYPKGLLEIMDVQGIGPKKAKVFYHKLKITNISELAKAAKAGKLRNIEGFGAKTEENILKGIALKEKSAGRMLLTEAIPVSKAVIDYLSLSHTVRRISPSGSLRRYCETVGDIDILCSVNAASEKEIIERFTKYPGIKRVLAKGDTKASIIIDTGVQVDLRVVNDSCFGAAMQYFTGSKEHNVALRGLAKDMGLTLNEYGVFKVSDKNRLIAGKTERDVYAALNMPLIPPELRENRGEIEAALKNKLPQLLDIEDIHGDSHVHSKYSDGENSIKEIARYAESVGYQWVIITDHSKSLKIARGLSTATLMKKINEVREFNKKSRGVKVLCGSEVDILSDGKLDYPDELLKELDFCIASVHSGFKQSEDEITSRIIKAIENPYVHCIGHPTGRLLNKREGYAVNMDKVMDAAASNKKILEINAFPERLDLCDIHIRKAKNAGIMLSIGTDSHATSHMQFISLGVELARRGWLEKNDLINTMPYDKLIQFLKKA